MSDPAGFIRAETVLAAPPLVPEIQLHLASEILPIWHATEADLERNGLPPPYWAFAWPGGQALTRHLLDHPDLVAGRRVLDFAAGSGLTAIAAAMAGASAVSAAEIDPFARIAIALNAAANGVRVTLIEEDIIGRTGDWDVILAGDVCYERPMAERIAGLVHRACARRMAGADRRSRPKLSADLWPQGNRPLSGADDPGAGILHHARDGGLAVGRRMRNKI